MKMNFDNPNKQEVIKIFPVIDTDKRDSFKDPINIGSVLKYVHNYGENKSRLEFNLTQKIKDLDYFFHLVQTGIKSKYFFSFDTKYEYARTNLSEKERSELFSTIASFFETVYFEKENKMKEIGLITSSVGSTVKEVNDCVEDILKLDSSLSKEGVLNLGYDKIFKLYEKLYGEKNKEDISNLKYSNIRDRFFKMNFKKYLKNWTLEELGDKYEKELILHRNDK